MDKFDIPSPAWTAKTRYIRTCILLRAADRGPVRNEVDIKRLKHVCACIESEWPHLIKDLIRENSIPYGDGEEPIYDRPEGAEYG